MRVFLGPGNCYMRKYIVTYLMVIFLSAGSAKAQNADRPEKVKPRVFALNPDKLVEAKTRLAKGDVDLRPAMKKLRADAEEALQVKPVSVMDKTLTPPSGDKHDYMSFGPYWWPDPKKKDGLPYIRRDGERNPEARTNASDRPAMERMVEAVETLALAYYFTEEEKYAQHAAQLLRVWFLRPETKMNPNLNFGQAIPGRTQGRGIGIIDTTKLIRIVDAVGLLQTSPSWTRNDQKQITAWFDAYLIWLRTSKHGKDEDRTKNNHATWYDAQVASFAMFVGKDSLAKQVLEKVKKRRIETQIAPDGRQRYELTRTKSFGYSAGNLIGFFTLASLGERVGVDLWHYQSTDGRSIRKALDYLAPYADPHKKWPYQQISTLKRSRLFSLLRRGSIVYDDPEYEALIRKLPQSDIDADRAQLLYCR